MFWEKLINFRLLETTYVGVDINFRRGFTCESYELPGVQLPHHHLPGLLDSPEGLGRALVVTVLHSLDLAKYLVGDSADLMIITRGLSAHSNVNVERKIYKYSLK